LPDAFDALWGVECLPCCLIACLVTDSIASTKPSTAIARLHKPAIPTQPKSFNPSPHAGAWQQQPAISITKSKTFCGRFGRPHHHDECVRPARVEQSPGAIAAIRFKAANKEPRASGAKVS